MKYLIVVANGLTDRPIAEKDNKTPLQWSETPNLDRLAKKGRTGSVRTIPESLPAGCDVSYLSLLGYEPEKYLAGYANFEAAGLGIDIQEGEIPLCCDFIILQSSHNDMIMKDYSAGQLPDEDSRLLLDELNEKVQSDVRFYPGKGPHNLMVMKSEPIKERLTPPNELIGEGIRQFLSGDGNSGEVAYIMNQAQIILHHHPYNKKRVGEGKDAVNSVWLWGNGESRTLPAFSEKYNKSAALVSASLLFQGMAKSAGVKTVQVEGATGYPDTNYKGKVDAALKELEIHDVVYLNIAGAEDVSLKGNIDDKIQVIEDFDREVLGKILPAAENRNDVKVLLVVNHLSSVDLMKYSKDEVPFVVYPAKNGPDKIEKFDEEILKECSEIYKEGHSLIDALFKGAL